MRKDKLDIDNGSRVKYVHFAFIDAQKFQKEKKTNKHI